MPDNYRLLQRYARGEGLEQLDNPAAELQYYGMVSSSRYNVAMLMVAQLQAISLELDRDAGDVMQWQYGAAEALNFVCVLHGGDEGAARVIVAARCVLASLYTGDCQLWRHSHGARLVAVVLQGWGGCQWGPSTSSSRMRRRAPGERCESDTSTGSSDASKGCSSGAEEISASM